MPRLRHPMQRESDGLEYEHLTLRRLHSQQLCVPLRTFRRFVSAQIGDPASVSGWGAVFSIIFAVRGGGGIAACRTV